MYEQAAQHVNPKTINFDIDLACRLDKGTPSTLPFWAVYTDVCSAPCTKSKAGNHPAKQGGAPNWLRPSLPHPPPRTSTGWEPSLGYAPQLLLTVGTFKDSSTSIAASRPFSRRAESSGCRWLACQTRAAELKMVGAAL